jgi:asparagine synthase (glutamine-hydrolysing)
MCGIAGVFYFDRRVQVEGGLLTRMISAIAHRGPDDRGYYVADGVGLAMCRLSVIDITGGNQPITNENSSIVVIQNGEIYNYRTLTRELKTRGHQFATRSDTEVIAHLFEDGGPDFPSHLHGMFAAAVFDRRARQLYLVRDRLGEKPLYIYQDSEKVVFASEIKALLATGFFRVDLDPRALRQYLAFNYVPCPRTLFKAVTHLPPAHIMKVADGGAIETRRYWQLPLVTESDRTEAETSDLFQILFRDSVEERLTADVPLGVLLSGGLDSTAVTWAASQMRSNRLHTFSIGFPGSSMDESDDAEQVSAHFGTAHQRIVGHSDLLQVIPTATWHCDQPHGDYSFLPLYKLCRSARNEVTVALTGDGADELFGGYSWHARSDLHRAVENGNSQVLFDAQMVFAASEQLEIVSASSRVTLGDDNPATLVSDALEESASLDPINRLLYVDLKHLLSGNNLVKPDRMGMAHGLELRTPFLDHRLVEFAFTVPGKMKIVKGTGKACVRGAMAEHLPRAVIEKPKKMFQVPVRDWFRGSGPDVLDSVLQSERTFDRGILNPVAIQALIREHRAATHDHTRKLRALVGFETWCRIFVDGDHFAKVDFDTTSNRISS